MNHASPGHVNALAKGTDDWQLLTTPRPSSFSTTNRRSHRGGDHGPSLHPQHDVDAPVPTQDGRHLEDGSVYRQASWAAGTVFHVRRAPPGCPSPGRGILGGGDPEVPVASAVTSRPSSFDGDRFAGGDLELEWPRETGGRPEGGSPTFGVDLSTPGAPQGRSGLT